MLPPLLRTADDVVVDSWVNNAEYFFCKNSNDMKFRDFSPEPKPAGKSVGRASRLHEDEVSSGAL